MMDVHTISDSDSDTGDWKQVASTPSAHVLSDSDDELIPRPKKRKRNSSKDSDETLDPNDDLELFMERSKSSQAKKKRQDSLSDDSDATIDLSPKQLKTVAKEPSRSKQYSSTPQVKSPANSRTLPHAIQKTTSRNHDISDSDSDDNFTNSSPRTSVHNKASPKQRHSLGISKSKQSTSILEQSKQSSNTSKQFKQSTSTGSSKQTKVSPSISKQTKLSSSTSKQTKVSSKPMETSSPPKKNVAMLYDQKKERIRSALKSHSSGQTGELSDSGDSDVTVDLCDVDSGSHGDRGSHGNSGSHGDSGSHGNSGSRGDNVRRDTRPLCRYGSKCYRKNPSHLEEFRHPAANDNIDDAGTMESPRKKSRLDTSVSGQPSTSSSSHSTSTSTHTSVGSGSGELGFLLTKVSGIPAQYNNTLAMDIKDILSTSMGDLVQSAQFNYMTDIPWLMRQYPTSFRSKPLMIVHGCQRREKAGLESEASQYDNIRLCQARLDIPYGTHHTKMMFLLYTTGLRVVIHTSNLIQQDWHQKTQGIWLSPLFPKLPGGGSTGGDSVTYFKRDLLEYITAYRARPLEEWLNIIKQHDMSSAKVYIIGSIPGRHTGEKKTAYGHLKLRKLLRCSGPSKLHAQNWPVVGQFSSIGSLGPNKDVWVCGEWLDSLTTTKGSTPGLDKSKAKLNLVFPCVDNVRQSLEGYPAGASLPYSINVAKKQPWLNNFFCQWQSKARGRSRASPHIKTYLRISPDSNNIVWFLVTSANLSKAAWGALEKNGSQLMIRSYELGVLFLPQHFSEASSFSVRQASGESSQPVSKQLKFPLPFDVPVTPYTKQDKPWIWDVPHVELPDTNGNMWCPS